jgi:DNA repair exonuclease SbcCD ATPase subunit
MGNFDNSSRPGSTATKPAEKPISYIKEAFHLQYNLIALAGAALFSIISFSPLPLLLAGGLELMYLSILPNNARFQRLVRSWKEADWRKAQQSRLADLFHSLPPAVQGRYTTLHSLAEGIRQNYRQLSSSSQYFLAQMEEKLDGLLHSYLRLLCGAQQHRDSLRITNPDQIRKEIAQLQKELEAQSSKVQDINRKRIEILQKRLEKFNKMKENSEVIDAQCAAIEDVLQLIRDQSVSMRDPQQVSEQLGGLVADVEQTEKNVQEVEAIFSMTDADFGQNSFADSTDSGTSTRNKIRS